MKAARKVESRHRTGRHFCAIMRGAGPKQITRVASRYAQREGLGTLGRTEPLPSVNGVRRVSAKQIVHLIDDDPAVLDATAFLLTAKGFEVHKYPSAQAFLDTAGPDPAGCVVTDVRMPGISGIELIARLKERRIALPVIVITAYANIALAVQAMKEGAVDLLEKPFNGATLVEAIGRALSPRIAEIRIGPEGEEFRARLATLTSREDEVLARMLRGLPNKLIAHELGVSTRTIETHRASVMAKMKVSSVAELVRVTLTIPRGGKTLH
jgi:two-component system response regulator FixJ